MTFWDMVWAWAVLNVIGPIIVIIISIVIGGSIFVAIVWWIDRENARARNKSP